MECSLFETNTIRTLKNNNKKTIKIKLDKKTNNHRISNDFIIKLKKNDEGYYDLDESLPKAPIKKNNQKIKCKFIRKTKHSFVDYNRKSILEQKIEKFTEKIFEQSAQTTSDKITSSPEITNHISIKLDHNGSNNKTKKIKILEKTEKAEMFEDFKVPLCICKSFWDTKEDMICKL